ncbi:hypothetical protein FHT78_005819 [Rhizobium sp. BK196]|jgi:hypothetical protein|uniref:hypothetical protein n=1 Tax=unclassified Rhizobium TaxID=2613769 RepID=UPI00161051A8|nr:MULTISPECIES: hypothetical protein [unclassified Rhizobium]MBB3314012.1 hypothetical protein [Rhizobium sp. BK196]MBB3464256.1 hypothetical protein [Rhizobium sp. BK377]
MRYYVYAIHTDDTRNRLHEVFDNLAEAAAIERELQSRTQPGDNYFVRMFPAQNVEEARVKADRMRTVPLMLN